MIPWNVDGPSPLWVRLALRLKRALGFRMMFGEIAAINGKGPCLRCVGRALEPPPVDHP